MEHGGGRFRSAVRLCLYHALSLHSFLQKWQTHHPQYCWYARKNALHRIMMEMQDRQMLCTSATVRKYCICCELTRNIRCVPNNLQPRYEEESGFLNLGNFCLRNPESRKIQYREIRNTAQGIRNPTNDWNSESTFHWHILESRI